MSAQPLLHFDVRAPRTTLWAGLRSAARRALQTRLLLLWLFCMAVPTVLFALPVNWSLGGELNHSPAAASLASSIGFGALIDLIDAPDLSFSLIYAVIIPPLLVMLVLWPWLNALALGAARSARPAGYRQLISAANSAYWPMVRVGLLGLVPITLALTLAQIAQNAVARYDAHAILESSVAPWSLLSWIFLLLIVGLANCTLEVARALLVAHPRRRSVVRAWWAGLGFLRRHPAVLFGTWLLLTLPAQLAVVILMVLRTNLDQGRFIGLVLALVLAEACVLVLAWMRCARLFVLVDIVTRLTAQR